MTQYLLSVHHAGSGPDLTEEEKQQSFADTGACNQRMIDAGAFVFAGGLLPPDSATTVRQAGADILVTDGPYLETKEHLGGFWVLDVADLDAALAWAKEATAACRLPVEVRPFQGNAEA